MRRYMWKSTYDIVILSLDGSGKAQNALVTMCVFTKIEQTRISTI